MTDSPQRTTIEAVIEMYGERPLPPIPRIPSSIYTPSKRTSTAPDSSPKPLEMPRSVASHSSPVKPSLVKLERIGVSNGKKSSSAKHLSQLYRKDIGKKSSTADKISERRKVFGATQSQHNPEAKLVPIKPVPFTEWRAPAYREPSSPSESSLHTCLSQRSLNSSITSPPPTDTTSVEQAASYFAAIHYDEPARLERGVYNSNLSSDTLESPFSETPLKDRVKPSKVPFPLITCMPIDIPLPSRFSPSSPTTSDADGVAGVASSLRARAKKAFLKSKTPKRPGPQGRLDSNDSYISHSSHTATIPSSKKVAEVPERSSMEQGFEEVHGNLRSNYVRMKPFSLPSQESISSKSDQMSPPAENLPEKEIEISALLPADYQNHQRNLWKKSKKHPYIYKKPRKRLPKAQPSTVPITTTTTANPDTPHKIKPPAPPTPKRPRTTLLFDSAYQLELEPQSQPPSNPSLTRALSLKAPTRNKPESKSHRMSHSITEITTTSSHGTRLSSNRLSRAESKRSGAGGRGRYSLPAVVVTHRSHKRQGSDDSTSSRILTRTEAARLKGKKMEVLTSSSSPALGFDREEEVQRGRREKRGEEGDRGRGSRGRTGSVRRREELKKRIRVMGEASAVGVPF